MSVKEWLGELEYRIEALRLQPDDVVLFTFPADRSFRDMDMRYLRDTIRKVLAKAGHNNEVLLTSQGLQIHKLTRADIEQLLAQE